MRGNMADASKYFRDELEYRLQWSTRKCMHEDSGKRTKWSIMSHGWRDIDAIDILDTNKRDITLQSASSSVGTLKVLHTNPETDETYESHQVTFNKTKWHGIALMKNIFMQSKDGIIYSTKSCKVYLGGHRYMSGVKNIGLSGLHSFDDDSNEKTIKLPSQTSDGLQSIKYANLVSFNCKNYFHFMVETLSRVVLFQRFFKTDESFDEKNVRIKYLVPTTKSFATDGLSLLGIDVQREVFAYDGRDASIRYFIEDLYLADW